MTTSCTHALEMTALLFNIRAGDEVIMPSYTFVSTANAFVLRGATIVFVDINPETMNMDEGLIERAVNPKTKGIVPMHYAGVSCEMDRILEIAAHYDLFVVEDAAHGIGATYKGKPLGSMGDFGTFSFHETKNLHCGEGGALLINNEQYLAKAEIIGEKGTNRTAFFQGEVSRYSWVDLGSSYLPSELNAAFLLAQLESETKITRKRIELWHTYFDLLKPLQDNNLIQLPKVPLHCRHNGHIFYLKCKDAFERRQLIQFLKERGIEAFFHYIPLHSSKAGKKFGYFAGEDVFTTKESERLLRLPMYYLLNKEAVIKICQMIEKFYENIP